MGYYSDGLKAFPILIIFLPFILCARIIFALFGGEYIRNNMGAGGEGESNIFIYTGITLLITIGLIIATIVVQTLFISSLTY